ncbi:Protein of unknown function [Pyronema omphalodes CBS 100304]|uniref:Uncharacterized protein n=1 Tax=Pyronema omphalodes (strain CBS 100304) TaxID=1076935 RepID=U4LY98_PYROM|nr:Protein of unknown function [Pyronema omphalodes CBS 100304]
MPNELSSVTPNGTNKPSEVRMPNGTVLITLKTLDLNQDLGEICMYVCTCTLKTPVRNKKCLKPRLPRAPGILPLKKIFFFFWFRKIQKSHQNSSGCKLGVAG